MEWGKIQIAKPGLGIECRAWFVVGEVLETRLGLFRWIQQARGRAAREAPPSGGRPTSAHVSNRPGSFWISGGQLLQSLLKPGGIELMDGEDPHTALGAAGLADQPFSTAAGSLGQRGVDNLDKFCIARGNHDAISRKNGVISTPILPSMRL